jgi:hypothetical protein
VHEHAHRKERFDRFRKTDHRGGDFETAVFRCHSRISRAIGALDKRPLLMFCEPTLNCVRLVILEKWTMQQCNKSSTGLAREAKFRVDKGADLACRTWRRRANARFQIVFLPGIHEARAPAYIEASQASNSALHVEHAPAADRVTAEEQSIGDLSTAQAGFSRHPLVASCHEETANKASGRTFGAQPARASRTARGQPVGAIAFISAPRLPISALARIVADMDHLDRTADLPVARLQPWPAVLVLTYIRSNSTEIVNWRNIFWSKGWYEVGGICNQTSRIYRCAGCRGALISSHSMNKRQPQMPSLPLCNTSSVGMS